MANWHGTEPGDDRSTSVESQARRDLEHLRTAARASARSLSRLLASPPGWLPEDGRTKLDSIHNICTVLAESSGRGIKVLESHSEAAGD
jgi:hypothetical protein